MPLPRTFDDFHANHAVLDNLRAAIASGRLPHSMILLGPRGVGKYTLAVMLTMALECERQPREVSGRGLPEGETRELASYCGECRNCTRIAESADLSARVEEAIATREEMKDTDKRETRVLVQTHPDVLIVPPDPPQLMIKLGQVRTVIQRSHYLPTEARARVFLFTSAGFMKEAANSLLKLLEEPPAQVHLILLAENLGELLPTIRSRCAVAHLGAMSVEEITALLAEHRKEVKGAERELVARLSEGAPGRALSFDLATYAAARNDALTILHTAERSGGMQDHSLLFKMTESYRAGAEGQEKTTALLRALSSVLEDLLLLNAGVPDRIRNVDKRAELERMATGFDYAWIESAVRAMDQVQSGMRRNLLRSLSLDAMAVGLESVR
ncbi:DNA polymerase-3 subunit delta' [Bryocella elongata]|uniref:DNA polymerase-3 subunit delta n=1 Tax=Bryocella elongata TaxID=863522 RepID=A0A1H5TTS3_9BACT|nr:DNA polymerase III subunit delta' [Bryocella elongata]SEF66262.1 DNA polymerase-3 subunit delta' [Bryocella elongata]